MHPSVYAEMLAKKISESKAHVWLVNTGWIKGSYGFGERIKLSYTRAMIHAALDGTLGDFSYKTYHIHSVFGVAQPRNCPGVPDKVLSPRATWNNDEKYYEAAFMLANAFRDNFKKFEKDTHEDIARGGPQRFSH